MTQQLFEPIQIIWDFVVTYWLVFSMAGDFYHRRCFGEYL